MKNDVMIDSVAEEKKGRVRGNTAYRILLNAMHHWNNMQSVRDEGERCHRFVNGNQWGDKIRYKGKWTTEYNALVDQGYVPRTVNIMNRVVNRVMGVIHKNGNIPTAYSIDGSEQGVCDVANKLMEANNAQNETNVLWSQQFKQFLEFGMLVSKHTFGYIDGKFGCWNENVDPRTFFCDTGMQDVRGWDCTIVGMIHTLHLDDILASFATKKSAKAGREMHRRICEEYGFCKDRKNITNIFSDQFGRNRVRNVDFLFPADGNMCRLIEVWTKETRPMYYVHDTLDGTMHIIPEDEYKDFVVSENEKRVALAQSAGVSAAEIATAQSIADGEAEENAVMPVSCRLRVAEWHEDRYWYCRWITPSGLILDEYESPFQHKCHPFVFVFYPFVIGEVRSYCADLIEEQKNLNKDSTMFVQIMKNSMKGFTVYDKNVLPEDDPDGERLLETLAQPGGAYGFDLKGVEQIQQKVTQMSSNNTGIGLIENIQMTQKNIEDISGVNGALQGKPGYSTTSGVLYNQQAQNATGSLLDVIECFYSFLMKNAYKQTSNMFQSYNPQQIDKIAGAGSYDTIMKYLDTLNSDTLELDFKMVEGEASAVYRQIILDYAQSWLQMGFIDFTTYLKITRLPMSDRLLIMLEAANQELEKNGEQPLPTRMPQQNVEASVAGANAMNGGANNAYNRAAATRPIQT